MMKIGSIGIIILSIIMIIFGFMEIGEIPNGISSIWGLFIPFLYIIFGIGVFLLKEWGRIGVIFLNIFIMLLLVFGMVASTYVYSSKISLNAHNSLDIVLTLACLLFLTRPKVKAQFKKE